MQHLPTGGGSRLFGEVKRGDEPLFGSQGPIEHERNLTGAEAWEEHAHHEPTEQAQHGHGQRNPERGERNGPPQARKHGECKERDHTEPESEHHRLREATLTQAPVPLLDQVLYTGKGVGGRSGHVERDTTPCEGVPPNGHSFVDSSLPPAVSALLALVTSGWRCVQQMCRRRHRA